MDGACKCIWESWRKLKRGYDIGLILKGGVKVYHMNRRPIYTKVSKITYVEEWRHGLSDPEIYYSSLLKHLLITACFGQGAVLSTWVERKDARSCFWLLRSLQFC